MAPDDDKTPEEMAQEQVEMYEAGREEIERTPSLYSAERHESKSFATGVFLGIVISAFFFLLIFGLWVLT